MGTRTLVILWALGMWLLPSSVLGSSWCISQVCTSPFIHIAQDPTPAPAPAPSDPGLGGAANPSDTPVVIPKLTNIPRLTELGEQSVNFPDFINNLYQYGIGVAGTLAVILLMWWGFAYMTSETPFKISQSRDRLLEIFIGLILILSPVIVFNLINGDIAQSIDIQNSLFGKLRGEE